MDLFEAISRRYSYRGAFTGAPVPHGDLVRIVEAGLAAPSGKNAQTTTFVIAADPAVLAKIRVLHPMEAVRDAKAFIACVVARKPVATYNGMQFEIQDMAAAVENMLLAVTSLGYATVWIEGHLFDEGRYEKLNAILGVPADRTIRVLLPIGVPTGEGPRRQKKPFAERAWFNRHG